MAHCPDIPGEVRNLGGEDEDVGIDRYGVVSGFVYY
jgi:hypothetical protein